MSDVQNAGAVLVFIAWIITWVTLSVYGDETDNFVPLQLWSVLNLAALWVVGIWMVLPG